LISLREEGGEEEKEGGCDGEEEVPLEGKREGGRQRRIYIQPSTYPVR